MLTGQCPDTPFLQSAGKTRNISLIKKWRNVMAEVGDHQSMVASLKQEGFEFA